ncbi:MAG: amidohydrolase family protein [bacterium]|nr:amidohydrolase family protein [bacterium]MCY4193989.1 amidohydrolase family protein [bacterium]MCY4271111.1 amidohydrolase family protein [bacterium]
MFVVDTHAHVISDDVERYPLQVADYPGVEWVHQAPVAAGELLAEMAATGVDRAVLVQAQGAYGTDNSYIAAARAAYPGKFGAVAIVDDPAELDGLAAVGVGGVRFFAVGGAGPLQDEATWAIARRLGLRVSAATVPEHLAALGDAVAAHPDVVLALDHCGFALDSIGDYAGLANLFLKVTPHVLDAGDPAAVLERLAEQFGVNRLMWGSDYSQTHDRPYAELAEQARVACAGLTRDERARFLGGTALALWPELAVVVGPTCR